MRRKCAVIAAMLILALLSSPCSPVHAHSGDTDSQGGHIDSNTGQYHYHHGYPAHDHYDMDGDGIIDCPYNFVDKTGENSGSYHGGGSDFNFTPVTVPTLPVVTPAANSPKESEVPIVDLRIVCFIVAVFIIIILCMLSHLKRKNREIIRLNKEYRDNLEKEQAAINAQLSELNADVAKRLGPSYLYSLAGAPEGNYINEDGLPAGPDASDGCWGERYTFYTAKTNYFYARKFHRSFCKYANLNCPVNAYNIKRCSYEHSPCALCHATLPDTSWVDRFLKYKAFFEDHGISVPTENKLRDESDKNLLGYVTKEMVEEHALNLGTDIDTALKFINHARNAAGLSPVNISNRS